MQALLAFVWSERHGWTPSPALRIGDISRRLCQRLLRIRDGHRRVRHLAAHHHADPDRSTDRRLWPAHARLWHREAASRMELAEHLAAHARHGNRHPDWRD